MQARIRNISFILAAVMIVTVLALPTQPTYAAGKAETEIAHIWRFAYQQSVGQGVLDIMIVEHDKDTHDILQVFDQFTYTAPCTAQRATITCDLDIKGAIEDSYYQMNLKDEAAKVRPAESYRWMITEATGSWSAIPANSHFLLADHPNLSMLVETNATGNAFRYNSIWNSHTSTSDYYRPMMGQSITLVNEFSCPTVGPCTTENYVIDSRGVNDLGSTQVSASTVGFQLAPSQIVIRAPSGFQLESFVIDPPKAGYG